MRRTGGQSEVDRDKRQICVQICNAAGEKWVPEIGH